MNEDKLVFVSLRMLTQNQVFLEAFPTDVCDTAIVSISPTGWWTAIFGLASGF